MTKRNSYHQKLRKVRKIRAKKYDSSSSNISSSYESDYYLSYNSEWDIDKTKRRDIKNMYHVMRTNAK